MAELYFYPSYYFPFFPALVIIEDYQYTSYYANARAKLRKQKNGEMNQKMVNTSKQRRKENRKCDYTWLNNLMGLQAKNKFKLSKRLTYASMLSEHFFYLFISSSFCEIKFFFSFSD